MGTSTDELIFTSLDLEAFFLFVYDTLFSGDRSGEEVLALLREIWSVVTVVGIIVIILSAVGITYVVMRLTQVMKEEKLRFEQSIVESGEEPEDDRWQRIVDLSLSDNPSDWRLSIIEADILLDQLLTEREYIGETLGEKLKNANADSFRGLDEAWEAHRVRNQIAHAGSDFILTQRETRRVIELYRRVFEGSNLL